MRIAITGAKGQLGTSLRNVLAGETLLLMDLPDHDITGVDVIPAIADFAPHVVIHAAAMTDVDGCELNPDAAFRVNALGTRNVALACQRCGAAMVYISTDYVFDGTKGEPYWEFDEPNPISIYGQSKLAGERTVQALLDRFYIVRTAWLYARGGNNFVAKILRLARERDELAVVTNEVGSPTYAPDLARAIARLIQHPLYGIYHLVNEGSCSRYEFARKILDYAGLEDYALRPLESYPRPARPPAYAPLRNFVAATQLGIVLRPWEEALRAYFGEER
ncbi:MAG TPA: dTDP-4-dehydrorhamnose reductase [Anaerolineae bacterium]|nr:dTDP-4-dehydrorhamnose reductase [Anaerolineae bacterium]